MKNCDRGLENSARDCRPSCTLGVVPVYLEIAFVLEVPLYNLRPSMCDSIPCDRIVQRAYCLSFFL